MISRGFISAFVVLIGWAATNNVSAQSVYNKQSDTVIVVDRGVKIYHPDSAKPLTEEEKKLIISSQAGTLSKVTTFHLNGVNVNCQDDTYGKTPIMWAVAAGQKEVFDYLLKNGAETSTLADVDGYTVLFTSTEHGRADMVKALLEHEGKNAVSQSDVDNVFIRAVQSRNTEMVGYFIDHGLSPGVMNEAATKADQWGMTDMLDYLASRGARLK